MELKCNFCNYKTVKKYNLIRHQIAKHNYDTENVNLEENICKKCNKMYKTKIYLIEHEKKCIGIDDLTCSRCMKTFSNRQNKYRHIKKNNCEPRSIIHARCSSKKVLMLKKTQKNKLLIII